MQTPTFFGWKQFEGKPRRASESYSRFDGVLATLGVALAVLVGTIGANVDVVEGVGFPLALQTEDMGGAQEYWYSAFASFQIAVQIILISPIRSNPELQWMIVSVFRVVLFASVYPFSGASGCPQEPFGSGLGLAVDGGEAVVMLINRDGVDDGDSGVNFQGHGSHG